MNKSSNMVKIAVSTVEMGDAVLSALDEVAGKERENA